MPPHREGGVWDNWWLTTDSPTMPCSPCSKAQTYPQHWTIGRVKFGIPLEQVCKNDIPGPLLVLILKLNKEGPTKKDLFRAPGHHGSMKKLVHFLQNGRLVNIDNFSVYTIASVLKKFLRKLPDGIFGREGEAELFSVIQSTDADEQRERIHCLFTSMPVVTQHLLVLLFGTFRLIATNANRAQTGMSAEALGVSVAPSFFQSCVADGRTAKMEDVMRFKAEINVATQVMKFLIDNFGESNLFGRANYEYYARITGRIFKVEEDWIFAFRYPPDGLASRQLSFEVEKTWLQCEMEHWGMKFNLEAMSGQEESQSTPALIHLPESSSMCGLGRSAVGESLGAVGGSGLCGATALMKGMPENNLRDSCTRLSISLEENGLYKGSVHNDSTESSFSAEHMTLDELRQVNRYAESTKSLSYLPQVHERQTERMRTRSEWFLSHSMCLPSVADIECQPQAVCVLRADPINRSSSVTSGGGSSEGGSTSLLRRSSSKDKDGRRLIRRSSSKKDKENGAQQKGPTLTLSRHRSSSLDVKSSQQENTEVVFASPRRKPSHLGAPVGLDGVGGSELEGGGEGETSVVARGGTQVTMMYKPRI